MDAVRPGPYCADPRCWLRAAIVNFWEWFKADGDKLFSFVSLASLALQGVSSISPHVTAAALIAGVLATAAHQSFFPNPPQGK
jgi:hypothetical protein